MEYDGYLTLHLRNFRLYLLLFHKYVYENDPLKKQGPITYQTENYTREKNVDQIKCGKNSWLFALKSYLSESPNAKDLLPIIGLDNETGGYINTLYFSMKLRILIFLCE